MSASLLTMMGDESASEDISDTEIDSLIVDKDLVEEAVLLPTGSQHLLPTHFLPSDAPDVHDRLQALLTAAGITKSSPIAGLDPKAFADPELLRRLSACNLEDHCDNRSSSERGGEDSVANDSVAEDGESLLSLACSAGYYELAQVLLAMNTNVEDRGQKGDCTPLMEAASADHVDIVKLLIAHGADVNAQSSTGNTPLMYACAGGHEAVVRVLLEAGALVDVQNENGHSPLMEASSAGHVPIAQLLVTSGAKVNTHSNEFKESPLTLACYKGHLDMVRYLLELQGKDTSQSIEQRQDELHTALMEASMDGHVQVAQLLLNSGAQVNMPADSFESPLTLAACGGHTDLAKLLLDCGANIEEVNDEGYTPLMEASREGHEDMVALLLSYDAEVNAQTEETGETALTLACCSGFLEVASLLIKHKADVELGANTPLMEAAQEGHLELVQFLIERGAKVNAQTATGDSALSYAAENGHSEVCGTLLDTGALIDIEAEGGRTPLMKACRSGHACAVQLLILRGADANKTTANNEHTALSLACSGGFASCVELLLQAKADPNHKLKDSSTMLIEAAKGGHTQVVQLLLDWPGTHLPAQLPPPLPPVVNRPNWAAGNIPGLPIVPTTQTQVPVIGSDDVLASIQRTLLKRASEKLSTQELHTLQEALRTQLHKAQHQHRHVSGSPAKSASTHQQQALRKQEELTAAVKELNRLKKTQEIYEELQKAGKELLEKGGGDRVEQEWLIQAQQHLKQQQCRLERAQAETEAQLANNPALEQLHQQYLQQIHQHAILAAAADQSVQANASLQLLQQQAASQFMSAQQQTLDVSQSVSDFMLKGSGGEFGDGNVMLQLPVSTTFTATSTSGVATFSKTTFTATLSSNAMASLASLDLAVSTEAKMTPLASTTSAAQVLQQQLQALQTSGNLQNHPLLANLQANLQSYMAATQQIAPDAATALMPSAAGTNITPVATVCAAPSTLPASLGRSLHSQMASSSVDVNTQTESNHDTALTLACAGGHEQLVSLLLARGADSEHRDKKGFTTLMLAATAGHTSVVETLLDHGASLEAQSERTKDTALSLACSSGRKEVVEILLRRGACKEHRNVSDYTPLSLAASGGYTDIINLLLNHGAEINSRTGSKLGISPLMLAAMNGHTVAVKLLLERGADINAQIETNRNTALTLACFQGRHEVVKLLLEYKANVEHRAKTGLTPMMEAASGGYVEVGKVLITYGADVNAPPVPSSKDTALTIAADKGHSKFVELLLRKSAQVDVKNKKGCSPLWLSANGGHLEVVQAMVKAGAILDAEDNRHITPLMAAFRRGHVKVVKWLVKHVTRFPSDQDCLRFIHTLSDNDLLSKCNECMKTIMAQKERQAAEANKAARILLQEIEQEEAAAESKRQAKQRQKEKKKQKRQAKKAATKPNEKAKECEDLDDNDEKDACDTIIKKPLVQAGISSSAPSTAASSKSSSPVPCAGGILQLQEKSYVADDLKTEESIITTNFELPRVPIGGLSPSLNMQSSAKQENSTGKNSYSNENGILKGFNRTNTHDSNRRDSKAQKASPRQTAGSENEGWSYQSATRKQLAPHKARMRAQAALKRSAENTALQGLPSNAAALPSNGNSKDNRRHPTNRIMVSAQWIARVIGRGGQNINAIREVTGAHIEVEKQQKNQLDRMIFFKGSQDAINQAVLMINGLINEPDAIVSDIIGKVRAKDRNATSGFGRQRSVGASTSVTQSNAKPTTMSFYSKDSNSTPSKPLIDSFSNNNQKFPEISFWSSNTKLSSNRGGQTNASNKPSGSKSSVTNGPVSSSSSTPSSIPITSEYSPFSTGPNVWAQKLSAGSMAGRLATEKLNFATVAKLGVTSVSSSAPFVVSGPTNSFASGEMNGSAVLKTVTSLSEDKAPGFKPVAAQQPPVSLHQQHQQQTLPSLFAKQISLPDSTSSIMTSARAQQQDVPLASQSSPVSDKHSYSSVLSEPGFSTAVTCAASSISSIVFSDLAQQNFSSHSPPPGFLTPVQNSSVSQSATKAMGNSSPYYSPISQPRPSSAQAQLQQANNLTSDTSFSTSLADVSNSQLQQNPLIDLQSLIEGCQFVNSDGQANVEFAAAATAAAIPNASQTFEFLNTLNQLMHGSEDNSNDWAILAKSVDDISAGLAQLQHKQQLQETAALMAAIGPDVAVAGMADFLASGNFGTGAPFAFHSSNPANGPLSASYLPSQSAAPPPLSVRHTQQSLSGQIVGDFTVPPPVAQVNTAVPPPSYRIGHVAGQQHRMPPAEFDPMQPPPSVTQFHPQALPQIHPSQYTSQLLSASAASYQGQDHYTQASGSAFGPASGLSGSNPNISNNILDALFSLAPEATSAQNFLNDWTASVGSLPSSISTYSDSSSAGATQAFHGFPASSSDIWQPTLPSSGIGGTATMASNGTAQSLLNGVLPAGQSWNGWSQMSM